MTALQVMLSLMRIACFPASEAEVDGHTPAPSFALPPTLAGLAPRAPRRCLDLRWASTDTGH